MLLALTYLLLAAQPSPAPSPALPALELRRSSEQSRQDQPAALPAPLSPPDLAARDLAPASRPRLPAPERGSGDGDHPDHMSPMWIVMGGVMVAMMVGVGVYAMSHGRGAAATARSTGLTGPAARAVPVAAPGGG